jgi:hypothetical protein
MHWVWATGATDGVKIPVNLARAVSMFRGRDKDVGPFTMILWGSVAGGVPVGQPQIVIDQCKTAVRETPEELFSLPPIAMGQPIPPDKVEHTKPLPVKIVKQLEGKRKRG